MTTEAKGESRLGRAIGDARKYIQDAGHQNNSSLRGPLGKALAKLDEAEVAAAEAAGPGFERVGILDGPKALAMLVRLDGHLSLAAATTAGTTRAEIREARGLAEEVRAMMEEAERAAKGPRDSSSPVDTKPEPGPIPEPGADRKPPRRIEDPCPDCGAKAGEPCTSLGGRIAALAGRIAWQGARKGAARIVTHQDDLARQALRIAAQVADIVPADLRARKVQEYAIELAGHLATDLATREVTRDGRAAEAGRRLEAEQIGPDPELHVFVMDFAKAEDGAGKPA